MEDLGAPLFVSWQLTKDCNLACVHCCTDSAPGRALPDQLSKSEALEVAGRIVELGVPYVMLCGGEPTLVPHFWDVAEALGAGGVRLKVETNGQLFGPAEAERLAKLPVRSLQISLDADDEETYRKVRPGASLAKAHAAIRAARAQDLPVEVTFAPTRGNIHHIRAVLKRAERLGVFRLNSGELMKLGTAEKLWDRVEPSAEQYAAFFDFLESAESPVELCFEPRNLLRELAASAAAPPQTLLLLSNGDVRLHPALPYFAGNVRDLDLSALWRASRAMWASEDVQRSARGDGLTTGIRSKQ